MKELLNRLLLAAFFVVAGLYHLADPVFFLTIVPPYLPFPYSLILVSGACEMILGILVVPSKTRVVARWGLIALLIAVLPANLHMALHPEQFPKIPQSLLIIRLPLQLLIMAWVYCGTDTDLER